MMHTFLINNRDELISRCKDKVSRRPQRGATADQLSNGIPLFLDQLTKTLQADEAGEDEASVKISGSSSGAGQHLLSEMSVTATAHGADLLRLGFTVDQVVHDYGDLCQAVTDLAFERDAPFEIDEFRTLNRCLDNAIADAVSEFSFHHDASIRRDESSQANERMGFLAHELRNALATATLSVAALEAGSLPVAGSTGSVLKRSLSALTVLIEQALDEVRAKAGTADPRGVFSLDDLVAEARTAGELVARQQGCVFVVSPVDPGSASRSTVRSRSRRWPTCCRTHSSSPGRAPRSG